MPSPSSPDRRPLLYGVAAVLIVIAALFIFWPRGGDDDEPTFTLESPTTGSGVQASTTGGMNPGEHGATDDPRAGTGSTGAGTAATGGTGPDAPPPEAVQSAQVTQQQQIRQEEMPEPAEAKPTTPRQTSSSPPADQNRGTQPSSSGSSGGQSARGTTSARGETGSRATSSGLVGPGPSGSYQVWAGSYANYDFAQRQVDELGRAGVEATVVEATSKGKLVYRVRIGFFQQRSQADAYAKDLKRRLGLDYWIGQR